MIFLPPHERLLRKGLEEEVYTGSQNGDVIGLSARIAADLAGFSTEPDARNVEYTTAPYREYDILIARLMAKRCRLRRYLDELDSLTLVPGSTLSLAPDEEFVLSNPNNPYYVYIRDTYGTQVVTASTHINLGIEDPNELLRACRVLRCEASLYLALTAASPFLKGELTGSHSTRWALFPKTPKSAPFFTDHGHFIQWMEKQLETGAMRNPRHLWLAIRANGPATPHDLNRLELRICDRISTPQMLGAITALFEARVWQVLENPELDPLSEHSDAELRALADRNEDSVAHSSLEAEVTDWRTGKTLLASELIRDHLASALETAQAHGFEEQLEPIWGVIENGNPAQRWIRSCEHGRTPREVLTAEIRELTEIDRQYEPDCPAPP